MTANLVLADKVFFFGDYCCLTSLQRYPGGCGVVTIEEFEKIEKFKMAAIYGFKNTKILLTLTIFRLEIIFFFLKVLILAAFVAFSVCVSVCLLSVPSHFF